jgi:hypothetical protein
MTLRTRRLLFYTLVFLFLITGLGAVLYSQGWRLDIENCQAKEVWVAIRMGAFGLPEPAGGGALFGCIQKTGAIFLKTKPKEVTIKIGGKTFEDKSGLITGGTLIPDLLPKTYRAEIIKEGYYSWAKNLSVKPELVAEAANIVLIPKEVKKEVISIPRLRGDRIASWNEGNNEFILRDSQKDIYYLYDLEKIQGVFNVNLNFRNLKGDGAVIKKLSFHPFDPSELIVETEKGLDVLDTLRLNLESILKTKPLSWTAKGNNLYYITSDSLYSFNLIVKTRTLVTQLATSSVSQSPIVKLETSESQNWLAFLDNSGNLYTLNQTGKNLQKIGHNVADFAFSPDNKKIAYLDKNQKLNISFLEDWLSDSHKKAGELTQFRLEKQALALKWYSDSAHLLLVYPDELKFTEIDDREPTNTYSLFKDIGGNFHYSSKSDSIYFLEKENLVRASI